MNIGFGYDEGYRRSTTLWGKTPSNNVVKACSLSIKKKLCLDLGCGEGKNSAYAAQHFEKVIAVDGSNIAIQKAQLLFPNINRVIWVKDEATNFLNVDNNIYDLIICTGMIHCLRNKQEFYGVINRCFEKLNKSGFFVFSSFNSREQNLEGHEKNFSPLLLDHNAIVCHLKFAGFSCTDVTDTNLIDYHQHIGIEHVHSITRVLCKT